ncbi:MAG: hypothetical protein FJY54_12120 [Betaproteobacteria bacterium]|nr:hypothetical protein [Betaproteobacteria bacterium]
MTKKRRRLGTRKATSGRRSRPRRLASWRGQRNPDRLAGISKRATSTAPPEVIYKRFLTDIFAYESRNYQRTKNPLYAWRAINAAIDGGITISHQVGHYLKRISDALQNIDSHENIARQVLRALEMHRAGGPSVFAQYHALKNLSSLVLEADIKARSIQLVGNSLRRVRDPRIWPGKFKAALDAIASQRGYRKGGVDSVMRALRRHRTKP